MSAAMVDAMTTGLRDRAAAYLSAPYARMVIPEGDGTYRGEILEFPGCIVTGDTSAAALEALEDAALGWLQSAIEHNQPIPVPLENTEFSGRLVLRMPKSLHQKAARVAEREGVSLNQFIVASLAEHVGERHSAFGGVLFNANMTNVTNLNSVTAYYGASEQLGLLKSTAGLYTSSNLIVGISGTGGAISLPLSTFTVVENRQVA